MQLREIADAFASPAEVESPVRFARGTVIAVDTAGKRVTIHKSGGTVDIPGIRYLASYTPAVGDIVQLVVNGPSIWVMGALA